MADEALSMHEQRVFSLDFRRTGSMEIRMRVTIHPDRELNPL